VADGAFDRVFASFFYGHLREAARRRFLGEAWRVAGQVVLVEGILRSDLLPVRSEERLLNDGTRWRVYKHYFTSEGLAGEAGGGEVLFEGHWFVVVQSGSVDGPTT
jgi:demethylmenaquinone methyltransferase/2-methoxy-6-polyprenyl-1,4-benzoquinol methylase